MYIVYYIHIMHVHIFVKCAFIDITSNYYNFLNVSFGSYSFIWISIHLKNEFKAFKVFKYVRYTSIYLFIELNVYLMLS